MRDLSDWEKRELSAGSKLDEADPIWGSRAIVYSRGAGGIIVISDRVGRYICREDLRDNIGHWSPAAKARLTTWISDQNRMGDRFPIISNFTLQKTYEGRNINYAVQLDRFFGYLDRRGYRSGERVGGSGSLITPEWQAEKDQILAVIEAHSDAEFGGFLDVLDDAGLIKGIPGSRILTAAGLERLARNERLAASADQAFVAMWFADETNEAFEKGIEPGLAEVGFRAFRIDRKEHANKIDDEIVAEIRRSRFLVADFTCGTTNSAGVETAIARGGVYYEAGLAQGLGLPVIWTVRQDQVGLVHFDTRQFNHITWSTPEELQEKLARRVAAVIGYNARA